MAKFIDLTGQRFGRLTVVSRAGNSKSGHVRWDCVCRCGGKITTEGTNLRSGNTNSCGCLQKERASTTKTKHGMAGMPAYESWVGMIKRCTNPSYTGYKDYGGRGIKVCSRWMKLENFYADMGERPEDMSIERKDNSGDYSPENCVYATRKEQNRNRRSNRIIKYDEKEQCLAAWAEELGVNYKTLWKRLLTNPPQIAFNI